MDNVQYVKLDFNKLLKMSKEKKLKTVKKKTLNLLLKNLKGGAESRRINNEKDFVIISDSDDPAIIETLYFLLYLIKLKNKVDLEGLPSNKYKASNKTNIILILFQCLDFIEKRYIFLQEKKKHESYFKTVLNLRKENKLNQTSNKLLLQLLVNIVKLRTTKELVDTVYEVVFSLFIEDLNIIPRNKKLLLESLKIQARNKKILSDGIKNDNIQSRNDKILLESVLESLKLESRAPKIKSLEDFLENELSSLSNKIPLQLQKRSKKLNFNINNKLQLKQRANKIKVLDKLLTDFNINRLTESLTNEVSKLNIEKRKDKLPELLSLVNKELKQITSSKGTESSSLDNYFRLVERNKKLKLSDKLEESLFKGIEGFKFSKRPQKITLSEILSGGSKSNNKQKIKYINEYLKYLEKKSNNT